MHSEKTSSTDSQTDFRSDADTSATSSNQSSISFEQEKFEQFEAEAKPLLQEKYRGMNIEPGLDTYRKMSEQTHVKTYAIRTRADNRLLGFALMSVDNRATRVFVNLSDRTNAAIALDWLQKFNEVH